MPDLTTTVTARPGGVMTHEVGTVTGELEIATTLEAGRAEHRVRYAGAQEWYRPEGVDPTAVEDEGGLRRAHDRLVASLRAPGGGSPDPADPPRGSRQGRDADDPAAGSFGGARTE